jgi:hypothetical protein
MVGIGSHVCSREAVAQKLPDTQAGNRSTQYGGRTKRRTRAVSGGTQGWRDAHNTFYLVEPQKIFWELVEVAGARRASARTWAGANAAEAITEEAIFDDGDEAVGVEACGNE